MAAQRRAFGCLVRAWQNCPDPDTASGLIERYHEAVPLMIRYSESVFPGEDLESLGMEGLYNAAFTFDGGRHVPWLVWLRIHVGHAISSRLRVLGRREEILHRQPESALEEVIR